jgi:hypothetical protein
VMSRQMSSRDNEAAAAQQSRALALSMSIDSNVPCVFGPPFYCHRQRARVPPKAGASLSTTTT